MITFIAILPLELKALLSVWSASLDDGKDGVLKTMARNSLCLLIRIQYIKCYSGSVQLQWSVIHFKFCKYCVEIPCFVCGYPVVLAPFLERLCLFHCIPLFLCPRGVGSIYMSLQYCGDKIWGDEKYESCDQFHSSGDPVPLTVILCSAFKVYFLLGTGWLKESEVRNFPSCGQVKL